MLARMPEADLSTRTRRELVLPPIERVPMEAQAPTGMDRFMAAGEKVVELLSPPAATLPDRVPVRPASGLAWQPQQGAELMDMGPCVIECLPPRPLPRSAAHRRLTRPHLSFL